MLKRYKQPRFITWSAGTVFTREWPQRTARLHRSAGGRILSKRICTSHAFYPRDASQRGY